VTTRLLAVLCSKSLSSNMDLRMKVFMLTFNFSQLAQFLKCCTFFYASAPLPGIELKHSSSSEIIRTSLHILSTCVITQCCTFSNLCLRNTAVEGGRIKLFLLVKSIQYAKHGNIILNLWFNWIWECRKTRMKWRRELSIDTWYDIKLDW